ncbi:hypothetical protein Pcinc_044442 [Petrolisthes cinctipes]|uniref:Vitelline membrane outer layer protein 1 n=1 Tax=Petrolisthes cinctipes TaxID=88211 RepID=A0AAE1BEQ1_PETCI|nr:hypothetical protein Pcinc_044442 [Petrolisthes cinctipes]
MVLGGGGNYGDQDNCADSSNGAAYAYALQFKVRLVGHWTGLGLTSCTFPTYTFPPNDLQFKYETLDKVDNTGGNSVKLFCKDGNGTITNYVTSLEGDYGDWMGIYSCPGGGFINGFRLRVFPDQGTFGDDFAVDNIEVSCSDGTILNGMDGINPQPSAHQTKHQTTGEGGVMEAVRARLRSSPERETRLNGEWGTFVYCSPGMKVAGIRTVVDQGHTFGDDAGLTDVTLYCI